VGTYLNLFPPGKLRDKNDVNLPDAATRSFWLNGSAWEYPNFENAETFVNRLIRRGLVSVDPVVTDVLKGRPSELTTRTAQRRFLRTTGLTHTTIEQIERARHATLLLKQGHSILDVVFETGYYDQAHLTRSLKHFVGQTPTQIIRAEEQLSFLYKTEPR
ncbi:MAG TPA: AraC family transcriptional regulator, partial [Pyrinomonadaceae bacterium]|nr:AraC family transcriptional regulator [Pyrinomonadaceae bacterium]